MNYVTKLSDLKRNDIDLAGGKGANLGELMRARLPVPPGFCVTTAGYRDFTAVNGIDDEIRRILVDDNSGVPSVRDAKASAARAVAIRELFMHGRVPDRLADEIRRAYSELGLKDAAPGQAVLPVAVRSSATAEDLPDLSFAGQQDTYLNVIGAEAVLDAVKRCWASLWTDRAVAYRARNGIPHGDLALAVVVQELVPSQVSGVLFTANPLTGKRGETVIDASFGLGEAIVSGMVQPDHFVVAGDRVVSRELGAKAVAIRASAGGGTTISKSPVSEGQALSDSSLLELARLGKASQDHFGSPQDMEWALVDGRSFVLQSRSITTLYPLPANISDGESLAFFSVSSMQGMLDPFTPLGSDIFGILAGSFSKFFGTDGTPESQRGLYEAGGRLFFNFTTLFRSKRGRALLRLIVNSLDPGSGDALAAIAADPRFAVSAGAIKPRTALALVRLFAPMFFNVFRNLAFPVRGRERLERTVASLIGGLEDRHGRVGNLSERLDAIEGLKRIFPRLFFSRLIPAVACGQMPLQFTRMICAGLAESENRVLELTRGLEHNVTTEMDLALWRTAKTIRSDGPAAELFLRESAGTVTAAYRAGALPAVAQTAIDAFMKRYGMRGPGEIDIGRSRWRDDPTQVIQTLAGYLGIKDDKASPEAVFAGGSVRAAAARDRLLAELAAEPGGKRKARLAKFMIGRLRELGGLRESPKFAAIRAMAVSRTGLLSDGRALVADGILEIPDDIFFLRFKELRELASGARQDCRTLVAERRASYEREKRRRIVPRMMLSDGTAFYEGIKGGRDDENHICGSPVSPGLAEGRVRVVFDPGAADLAPGDILVCRGTDPAWTPLFLTAGGLVMEVGGMVTHGSVVAREYGIPAVVGVTNATSRLKDGQLIRLDGSSGRIEIVESGE